MFKHLIVITGASKGFGKEIAIAFTKEVKEPLHFILSGRNQQELSDTKNEICNLQKNLAVPVTCNLVIGDITDINKLDCLAEALFGNNSLSVCCNETQVNNNFVSATFVNNAGSLGPLRPVGSTHSSLLHIHDAINLNVTGCIYLTNEFIKRYFLSYDILLA